MSVPNASKILSEERVSAFTYDFQSKRLKVLNQLLLPDTIEYVDVSDCEAGYGVIKSMMVRGAPCIAAVGCLSILAELGRDTFIGRSTTPEELLLWLEKGSEKLISARPTAINLKNALRRLLENARSLARTPSIESDEIIENINDLCLRAVQVDYSYGADEVSNIAKDPGSVSVPTHCNTGAFASIGYGSNQNFT